MRASSHARQRVLRQPLARLHATYLSCLVTENDTHASKRSFLAQTTYRIDKLADPANRRLTPPDLEPACSHRHMASRG